MSSTDLVMHLRLRWWVRPLLRAATYTAQQMAALGNRDGAEQFLVGCAALVASRGLQITTGRA